MNDYIKKAIIRAEFIPMTGRNKTVEKSLILEIISQKLSKMYSKHTNQKKEFKRIHSMYSTKPINRDFYIPVRGIKPNEKT